MLTLLCITALLLPDHRHLFTVKFCKTAHDRRIVGIPAVAVDLYKIRKDTLKQIDRVRPVRMACIFDAIECGEFVCFHRCYFNAQ
jgi:hypothetical protein